MRTILLAGCGDLGTSLGLLLAKQGWEVWGLRRHAANLPSPLHGWSADLQHPHTLQHPPTQFDAVVYTATPDQYDEMGYRGAYVDGVRNILTVLQQQSRPFSRFLLVSSTSVYDQNHGEMVDELSPATPSHYSGKTILEGESLVQALGERGTIVRFGGIYGPSRLQLLQSVIQGTAVCYDGPPRYTNRVHREDCIHILFHLLQLPSLDPLYLGVDHDPAPSHEVLCWMAEQLGVPAPPTLAEHEAPQGRRTRSNKRCSNKKLLASGYTFLYPTFREGYHEIILGLSR